MIVYTNVCGCCVGLKQYQSIGMKEQFEMFELVTNELKQAPVVIDSEDLVTHPGISSRTCQASRLIISVH